MPRPRLYPAPSFVLEHTDELSFQRWLKGKATSLVRRDRQRGGTYSVKEAKAAIYAAVVSCNGLDHWTGEPLRWDLLGAYNNEESSLHGAAYKRSLDMVPTVDHRDSQPILDFVICGWRTNDAKTHMTIEELKSFCRLILERNP